MFFSTRSRKGIPSGGGSLLCELICLEYFGRYLSIPNKEIENDIYFKYA